MQAKKFIEKTTEGEYELIKNKVIDVPENFNIQWICDYIHVYDMDGEDAYHTFGVLFHDDGEILCIKASKFVEGVTNYLHEYEDDDFPEGDIKKILAELNGMEKYSDYDIYP